MAPDAPMPRLQRTYSLRGLDRILYANAPRWKEGTFEQEEEDFGHLVLRQEAMSSAAELTIAIHRMDQQAKRFMLAISRRICSPLTLKLEKSEEPNFDEAGFLSARDAVGISGHLHVTTLPKDPPATIEQLCESAARWVLTLAETRAFSGYPDEVMKRHYLLIEGLSGTHGACLSEEQRGQLQELKWVRDFVSHSTCGNPGLCAFIAGWLPSAVISTEPPAVRFERTQLEHRNFVGRYQEKARDIVNLLLNTAIEALRASGCDCQEADL